MGQGGTQNRKDKLRSIRGSSPLWLPTFLVLGGLSWMAGGLQADATEEGFTLLDASRVALRSASSQSGLPTDWSEIVAAKVARLGDLHIQDETLIERVLGEIEALPFVSEVGTARVVWPDGISVDVRLREPVACICLGEWYLPVSADGVVLPSSWPEPPDFGRGLLPVIGPMDESFLHLLPGDQLQEKRHLDALSVAASMRDYLSPGDTRALGPVVIDATDADRATVSVAGTHLYLAGARDVFFGRPPSHDSPGELPTVVKWQHVMDAVALLDGAGGDWDLLDARWDTATVRPRVGYR